MHCPTCTTTPLVLAVRQGVEIDYCPHCRGVWLDRGELDKLIERSDAFAQPRPAARDRDWPAQRPAPRRGSWLAEIFD